MCFIYIKLFLNCVYSITLFFFSIRKKYWYIEMKKKYSFRENVYNKCDIMFIVSLSI